MFIKSVALWGYLIIFKFFFSAPRLPMTIDFLWLYHYAWSAQCDILVEEELWVLRLY